ncbi:MAG: DUF6745 domain-containing protein, partial [Acidobacteriota bacterium]
AQVWTQVWDQVEAQVGAQVRAQVRAQVWDQVGVQVGTQVWAQVGAQVRDQVRDHVRDQIRFEKLQWFDFAHYGNVADFGWASFFDYFREIGVLNHANFEKFCDLLRSGIYDCIQFDGLCIVSTLPSHIKHENNNGLHSETNAAIGWSDGYELHYLHGIYFEAKLWKSIVDKTISPSDLLNLSNQEQKSAALRVYGYERSIEAARAKFIDKKFHPVNGKQRQYQVIEANLQDDDVPRSTRQSVLF